MTNHPHDLSLDGPWSFTTDPYERGEREAWFARTSGFGREVTVPAAWQLYGRDLRDYTGAAWYHREVEIPAAWQGQRLQLAFGACDYLTRAWLNGQFVGEHEGGFSPFLFDLTDAAVLGGLNHLVVRVYDPQDLAEVPHGSQGSHFTRVSGIWQGVRLVARPPEHLATVTPRAQLDPDRIEVAVGLAGEAAGLVLRVRVLDARGGEVAAARLGEPEVACKVVLEVPECHRWHPDDPYLYTVETALCDGADEPLDVTHHHVGVRGVAAIDGRLYLNGQPLLLRGAVDHGYWPGGLYAPPSDEEIQRELRLAKEAGLNVIRKHGKLEDPRWLDWCDRLGMLVWAELPACDRWTQAARKRFRRQLQEALLRDMHRPSLIAWSLHHAGRGLEEAGEHLQPWLRQLHDEATSLDPTRPICTHAGGTAMRTDLHDEHHRYVLPEESRQWTQSLNGDVPAAGAPRVVSEFGLWGLPASEPDDAGQEAWWLAPAAVASPDEARWPGTAEDSFERYKLAAVFETFDNLAKLTQRRLTRGLKGLVEELRRRPAFAGYVARSFADSEWEASGCLDFRRRPKLGFEDWASFNGPIALLAEIPRRNLWAGDTIAVRFYLSNHTRQALSGTLVWGIDGADCDGELEVSIAPYMTGPVGEVTLEVPALGRPQATRLAARVVSKGWELATNSFELTISPRSAGAVAGLAVACGEVSEGLRVALNNQGFAVEEAWEPGLTMVTESLTPAAWEALERGARVLFLAERGARAPETGYMSFRELPHGSAWARSTSVHYIQ
ncbi:MAG: glycoside hydrolase family 2 TIM barrel-domain containing protein, partial [Candidatus Sericytochromatia bacterium]|nr:glycoside hydrolase family 2 TIM barrel-domain containing protein [Candidatus Sericytochromatia bacterium]